MKKRGKDKISKKKKVVSQKKVPKIIVKTKPVIVKKPMRVVAKKVALPVINNKTTSVINKKTTTLVEKPGILQRMTHPIAIHKWSIGQRAADRLTGTMGSWTFIIFFLFFIVAWMAVNVYFWVQYMQGNPFDPYPFILLNLVLSCLAAIQAPIILMSQKREGQRDRVRTEYDHQINIKVAKEIDEIQAQLNRIESIIEEV